MSAQRAMSGGSPITETALPADMDGISCAMLDETVDIHLVRLYFTQAAWTAISAVKTAKNGQLQVAMWAVGDDTSLVCEACFVWYHLRCCRLKHCPMR